MRLKHTLQSYHILEIDKFMFALPQFFTRPFVDGNDCKFIDFEGKKTEQQFGRIGKKFRKASIESCF